MKKKTLCMLLGTSMVLSLAACGNKSSDTAVTTTAAAESEESEELSYDDQSAEIYENALGEFYDAYEQAEEAETVSERYALQAISEAKLLESAVLVPTTTDGGYYALSKAAPYTVDYSLWGTDNVRYHSALVATELIKAEDRAEMKAQWKELKGTGTYYEWAKNYLAEKGYELKDEYTYAYNSDPVTWDILATSLTADSDAIVNTYDGLMEYDCEGNLQPALATGYEVSDDGLTYTFHIREGVTWVDSQGRKVDDVKADDFVAGMQHALDAQGGLEYLVDGVIEGADEYIYGQTTDFEDVGVKAVDDYTLEYTLTEPTDYFVTMLSYSIFAPMSRSYYESQGGKFGSEYDPSASDYTYATSSTTIAYCGPYLVTNATAANTIVFSANESYWNYDNLQLKKITWLYNDGSDATKAYNDVLSGVIDGTGLNTSALEMAKEDGNFDTYVYTSATDATTFNNFYNLNRQAFSNVNDETKAVSSETEEDIAKTNAAMQNVHFRRAISYGFDRASYNAQSVGEEIKENSLRNTYTPGNFVSLTEDVTVSINGTDTTFAAGTYYGEIIQAQLDADEIPITAWDPSADDGNGSSDGFDGWYNVDNAVAELDQAIDELSEDGITIDEENPVYLEIPYPSNSEEFTNKANAYKQSIETSLGGKVIVNLVECTDEDQWYYAGYFCEYGYEMNYDLYDCSGWGPDYGDPKTYLDTFLPDYAGYMTKCFGIF